MSRALTALDRLATLLLGLVLLAVGAGILIWHTGAIADTPTTITCPGLVTAAGTAWWPWATTASGVVLVLAGMRWLMSHGPAERTRELTLTGSSRAGRLTADLGSLADAAATNLARHPALRSAKAKAVLQRRTPSIHLDATAASADTLAEAARAVDDTATTAIAMIGDTVAVRTRLHVDTKWPGKRRLA
jgi:hypothetical protein